MHDIQVFQFLWQLTRIVHLGAHAKNACQKQPKCIGYSGILHLPNFHKISCTCFQREMKVSPMGHFLMKNIE